MGPHARTVSLRAHLLLLVIGTTVPVLLITAVLVRQVIADNRASVEQRLQESARATATVLDAELVGTIRALQGLAESDQLTSGDVPAFYQEARRLIVTQRTWSAISLSTLEGRQIANTSRAFGDPLPDLTDHDSFDRAVATHMPAIGNLRLGAITHRWGFLVRVPVTRNAEVTYVLSAWIGSDAFGSALRRGGDSFGNVMRAVVDASGTIVVRFPDSERFVGRKATEGFLQRYNSAAPGMYRDVALDGTPVYTTFIRAPMSHWVAAVAAPVADIDAPFRSSMVAFAAVALLLLGLGGGGTYVISRRMAHDISTSAAAAESISHDVHPPAVTSKVTELQRLFDALADSAALLERRRQERDEQLARADEARARAEAADRAKDEFLALLGHELRNPLAPALTAIHLMKLRGGDSIRERDIIERQIRHMARLVDDLLDVARLRRGAIELRCQQFELAEAINRAVEMTTPLVEERRHRLDVEIEPGLVIDGDAVRVAQVVSNVLANAAKYTEPGGHITLRAFADGADAIIECRDNGIGMSPDLRERAFDLFVQGQQGLDRRQGGLGLGLAVSRALVELHRGTISAVSDGVGQGSTITARLPRVASTANTPAPRVGEQTASSVHARSGCVLIVDDNRDALETLLDAVQAAGLRVAGAGSASEAIDVARRVRPDVAVLDIGLPGTNGFELAGMLRRNCGDASLRIVALTGYGRDQDRAAAAAAGFDAFLVKPVDVPVLLDTVRQFVESSQSL